ncbi:hypothetical protein SprV_0501938500 [Sparganum proliferum]
MLDSEYVIPRLSKLFAPLPACANATNASSLSPLCSGSPPHSFLGRLLAGYVGGDVLTPSHPKPTALKSAVFGVLSHSNFIITLLIFWILVPPCVQFLAGVSLCRRRRNSKVPISRCLEGTFLLFSFLWLCSHGTLLVGMVVSSVEVDSDPSLSRNASHSLDMDTIIGRVDTLGTESFRLLKSTAEKSMVTINELVLGLKSDLSKTALGEISEITDQFLRHTDLETALDMLHDLAQMVEDLLHGHTYLRVNGPLLSSTLDKLDSILKMSGQILSSELAAVRSDCRNSLPLPQSLDKFDKLVTRLERGLHDRPSSTRTFFEEFRLESSLGLFNMLSLLPFNVSEVLEQLHGAAQMRTELEASLHDKTQNLFSSLPLPKNPNDTAWLNPYFAGVQIMLDEASDDFHQAVRTDLRGALRTTFLAECLIYTLALFSLALPICLLIVRSVHCRAIDTPDFPRAPSDSQTTDITSTRSDRSLTDTLASTHKKLSSDPASPPKTCRRPAEDILCQSVAPAVTSEEEESSASDSGLSEVKQNSAERMKLLSKSDSSMSGIVARIALPIASEESDCLKLLPPVQVSPALWSRTDTLDSVTRKRRRGGRASCEKRRLWTALAYVITCICLCLLTFTASFLAVSTGLLQTTICLPLSEDTHRRSLDAEINGITNRNWDIWMDSVREFVLSMIPAHAKAMSSAANLSEPGLRNILRIQQPRNLITTLLQTCAPQSYDSSYDVGLIQAMGVTVRHNFSGLLDITLVQESSDNIKTAFEKEAVQLVEQKLQEGLLPANFELLLSTLKEEEARGVRAAAATAGGGVEAGSSVLDTAERFWRQSTEGAAERLEAINSSLVRFRSANEFIRRLHTLQQKLIEEVNSATARLALQPTGQYKSCFDRLTNLPHLIDFNSRLIDSARRDFPARLRSQELIAAASDLARISRQPSFTKTLTDFATLAFDLGLSVSSSAAAKEALVARVRLVTGREYDRLVRKLLNSLGASIFDARINAALEKVLRPCTEVGRIAQAALTTVCPAAAAEAGRPTFVPILLRLSLLAFLLALFALASQILLLFMGCLGAVSVCCRTEHESDKS